MVIAIASLLLAAQLGTAQAAAPTISEVQKFSTGCPRILRRAAMVGISLLTDCAIPTGPYPITTRLRGDMDDIAIRCRVETARTLISGMAVVIRTALFPGAFSKGASINTATNHGLSDGTTQGPKSVVDHLCARRWRSHWLRRQNMRRSAVLPIKVQVSVSMSCDSHAVSCVGVVK